MKIQGWCQTLIGCVFPFVLVLFFTGCGGGATSGGNTPTGGNLPPGGTSNSSVLVLADAGDIIGVRVNETVTLDGSGSSTTSTEPLAYAWSFTSKPDASNVELQNATSVNPGFIADVKGTYMVQLVVSAGGITSQRAIASVEITIDGNFTGDKRVHTSYPSKCAECHDGRFAEGEGIIDPILPKSGNHLATSNMCEACHTTFGFNLIRFVDHLEVFGKCSTCHNGCIGHREI